MDYIISESRLNQLVSKYSQLDAINQNVIKLSYHIFDYDWDALQSFLKARGNPPYILLGDINLVSRTDIDSLGSVVKVLGDVNLGYSTVSSLGDLRFVGGNLNITKTPITNLGELTYVNKGLSAGKSLLSSLGPLEYVGDDLYLKQTPISKTSSYDTKDKIRKKIVVLGTIFLD